MAALLLLLLATTALPEGVIARAGDDPITPSSHISLFDGKGLGNFYTWLVDHKYEDPNLVFSVVDQIDGASAIRISGQNWGGLVTRREYANYRLVVEFRWGLVTWGDRKDRAKDSGVLLHSQGPDGGTQRDFNGPWMRSVECQIIEGGVGDIILLGGYDSSGEHLSPKISVTVKQDRNGEPAYHPGGRPTMFEVGSSNWLRVNWRGRDPSWRDALGFRGKRDVESPDGRWTRLEVVCEGDTITNIVNGKVVNVGRRSSLTGGKIMLQSEGAEIFFRRIDLLPLGKKALVNDG